MQTKIKPARLRRREIDTVLTSLQPKLRAYYNRAVSHVDLSLPRETLMRALVRPHDIAFVENATDLYGYTLDYLYHSLSGMAVSDFPGVADSIVFFEFYSKLGWVPPGYLSGDHSASDLPEAFVPTFSPIIEQLAEFHRMHTAAARGVNTLVSICEGRLQQMRLIWPAVEIIANECKVDLDKLPRANGVPALPPGLRSDLEQATLLINAAMMMPPEAKSDCGYDITLQ